MATSNYNSPDKPLLPLGQVVATPGAIAALDRVAASAHRLLERHQAFDYGDLSDEDRQANDDVVLDDDRVLSSYTLSSGEKIWIVTEADRSSTTILTPDEY